MKHIPACCEHTKSLLSPFAGRSKLHLFETDHAQLHWHIRKRTLPNQALSIGRNHVPIHPIPVLPVQGMIHWDLVMLCLQLVTGHPVAEYGKSDHPCPPPNRSGCRCHGLFAMSDYMHCLKESSTFEASSSSASAEHGLNHRPCTGGKRGMNLSAPMELAKSHCNNRLKKHSLTQHSGRVYWTISNSPYWVHSRAVPARHVPPKKT